MPFFLLIAAMTLTGANVPIGKVLIAHLVLADALALRFVVATIALALLLNNRDWQALAGLSRRDWLIVAILAVVGSVLFSVFILAGTAWTSASDAGIITATLPAVVTVAAALTYAERPGAYGFASVGLAVLGLAVLAIGRTDAASSLIGNALVMVAVACEATFVLASRAISARLSPICLSFAVAACSAAVTIPVSAATSATQSLWALTPQTWLLALWYGLSASVFCTVLWYAGVGRVPSWQAGVATAALPLSALAVSILFLGEIADQFHVIGGGCVVAAIVLGAVGSRRAAQRPCCPPD